MQLFLKYSVDPDQTTLQEQSALFAYATFSETLVYKILGHSPYVGNNKKINFKPDLP